MMRISQISSDIVIEMSVQINAYPIMKPGYILNVGSKNGVSSPLVVESKPNDFRKVLHRQNFDSNVTYASIDEIFLMKMEANFIGVFKAVSCTDPPLTAPFGTEAYYLPPPYPEFSLGLVMKEVYSLANSSACSQSTFQYSTPIMQPRDRVALDFSWYKTGTIYSTSSEIVDSGLGPHFWYGAFGNSFPQVRLMSLSDYKYSYASRTYDIRPASASGNIHSRPGSTSDGIPTEIHKGDSLVFNGFLNENGGTFTMGYGSYRVKLKIDNFYISGKQGLATVNAGFNTAASDPNPPYLTRFALEKDGRAVYPISYDGGEQVCVEVNDEVRVASVKIYYNPGNGAWIQLSALNLSSNMYTSVLPAAVPEAVSTSLRISAADEQGNTIEYETPLELRRRNAKSNDFDGDGISDMAVYQPAGGMWHLSLSRFGADDVQWGAAGDIPVPADYDGDGLADIAVWRPSTGVWYIRGSAGGYTAFQWGASTDKPVQGDYDGDGRSDFAVWNTQTGGWEIAESSGNVKQYHLGISGDKLVPADYDGDGVIDFAVWRPSSGIWYIDGSLGLHKELQWGAPADIPVPADYDGDKKDDIAVWRPGNGYWYVVGSSGVWLYSQWGAIGDKPQVGDYDGDGKADLSVWRPGAGIWYFMGSLKGYSEKILGAPGDQPLSMLR
jgi:hypothetical protein